MRLETAQTVNKWVSDDYEVSEDVMGLVQLPNTKSDTLTASIEDCLIRMGLPLANCSGQGYDGAAIIQGRMYGVVKPYRRK